MTVETHISNTVRDALQEKTLMLLPIVQLEIGDTGMQEDFVQVWGGVGDLTWDGNTWLGVGNLGEVDTIKSDTKGTMNGLSLSLSGFPADLLQDIKTVAFRGRRGLLWVAAFDEDMAMIDEAALMFAGEISTMNLHDAPGNQVVNIELESRMSVLKRSMPALRTDEDHQRRYPGDKFFEFVPNVMSKTIYWGMRVPTNSAGTTGGGSRFDTQYHSTDFQLR